jgi:hypothetical protein
MSCLKPFAARPAIDREARAHEASHADRRFAKAEDRNIEQLAQRVQAGLEDIADQERVISFAFGLQPVFKNFVGIKKFEIAILVSDRASLAEPMHVDDCAGRGRTRDELIEGLSVRPRLLPS